MLNGCGFFVVGGGGGMKSELFSLKPPGFLLNEN